MRILFVYRNPRMGYSIGHVFNSIEEEIKKHCDVDAIYLPKSNYSIWSLYYNIKAVRNKLTKGGYDIVHITGTEHYLLPFLGGIKKVVTVHDFGSLHTEGRGLRSYLKKVLFVRSLTKANKITFISSKTEREGREEIKMEKGKCCVINNPVSPSYHYVKKDINYQKPVILHIGTKSNKNLIRSIEALSGKSIHLRIIGKLTEEQKNKLLDTHIEFSNVWNLSDEQIVKEYETCDIVSFPSLYEGFGMPILEGQAIGRVVLTSNIEPMKSIANDSAILVDPYNIDSIRQGYEIALCNSEEYINKGLENVKRFSVDKIAIDYFNLYQSIL